MSKHIVIGVTGGIAAYKALDVVSGLRKLGYTINVIMTKNACEFVNPLSFQTLSNNYVITDTFERPASWEVEHIALAKKADLFLIAPASANIIGKVAHGIADDMLSTTIMATKCPVLFAPAMNTNMYENSIVQENMEKLKSKGYLFLEPASGWLACGDLGKGKLPTPDAIVQAATALLNPNHDLANKHVLVTAGPTLEAIDAMRYISNHSSGKMGYAIAEAAAKRGAQVTLISGPTNLPTPSNVSRIDIVSALDMFDAVMKHSKDCDIVIKAAAVADYRPLEVSQHKIKKTDDDLNLALTRNPDILQELGKQKANKILVGFAAETQNLIGYAKEKIEKKNLDLIVANNISTAGSGFQGDTNIVTLIDASGNVIEHEQMSKAQVSDIILDKVVSLLNK